MDIKLSEEQQMIKDGARSFLEKKCPSSLVREIMREDKEITEELWREMAELGWMGLVIPEGYGGSGGSFFDLVILLEEMGRALVPGPFFSNVLGACCLLETANVSQKRELLPKISKGEIILTLALEEPEMQSNLSSIATTAKRDMGVYRLNGTKLFVSYAQTADYIVCVVRSKDEAEAEIGLMLFIVDGNSKGISRYPLKTLGEEKLFETIFQNVEVSQENVLGRAGEAYPALKKILQRAAVGKCAEMVGAGQKILDMVVVHAKERVQFGRPIGSFQAIQHHCANMLIDLDACRWITYKTAWTIDKGDSCELQAAMTKAWCNEAFRRIVSLGHQVLGGIGYAEEHDMPLYFRKARMAEVAFGDTDYSLQIVAEKIFQ